MIKFLSHKISPLMPAYGSTAEKIAFKQASSIGKDSSCRLFRFGMNNHCGTHVDCPAHFFVGGRKVADYPAGFWLFRKPQVCRLKVSPGRIISKEDLTVKINPKTDLLLLRSGWSRFRGKPVYSLRNPGIDPMLGGWLRKEYPLLRAVGIDWISISSYQHRDLGRQAHRKFLDPGGTGHPILIIEDMDLSLSLKGLKEVWLAPLRLEKVDSAPCTVLGVFE